jgi:hypothetical protein
MDFFGARMLYSLAVAAWLRRVERNGVFFRVILATGSGI